MTTYNKAVEDRTQEIREWLDVELKYYDKIPTNPTRRDLLADFDTHFPPILTGPEALHKPTLEVVREWLERVKTWRKAGGPRRKP